MATFIETGNLTDTWEITGNDGKWTLADEGSVNVGFNLDDFYGIDEASVSSGNTIHVRGDVTAAGQFGLAAIHIAGTDTKLRVFESSKLVSDTGIMSTSAGAIILNEGTIEAGVGIDAQDAKRITNAGDLTGQYGILSGDSREVVNSGLINVSILGVAMEAGGTVLRNLKGGVIDATSLGVEINGTGAAKIVNAGEIIGGLVDLGADLTLVNRNRLEGEFYLGTGDDVFDTRKGELVGQVDGGLGDDVFKISSTSVMIIEHFNEGYDKVVSSAAYDLTTFVEDLTFTGTKDIDGTGNDGANIIIGNKGRNDLSGNGGEDVLSGGRGNDRLFGGDHGDVFAFRKNFGKDLIEDFEDGFDLLRLGFVKIDKAMQDLLDNHVEQCGDDLVITYGADRLTIRNLDIEDFSKDDLSKLDL